MPGQICTRPLAISCEPTHWLNWPMESTSPPFLCRKAGVQGSSKAWSFRPHFFPSARKKSPKRKKRGAPAGANGIEQVEDPFLLDLAAMGISAGSSLGKLERMPSARVTTPLTPAAISSARS